jgi:hypothetical protein
MSSRDLRNQLERIQRQRADAEKRVGEFRTKEAEKRTAAARKRESAARNSSPSAAGSYLREAGRLEDTANSAAKDAARWQAAVARFAKDEASLHSRISSAERSERDTADRQRIRDEQVAARRVASDRQALIWRLEAAESAAKSFAPVAHEPKRERLRILMLGASSEGDLRVGREQKRIRAAVESALHRDLVDLDVRPAATTCDLLDGITKFRPHVVHFSDHSDENLIVFEDEVDESHPGIIVTAGAFANALAATDDPPLLVFVNACRSAVQLSALVDRVAPFAIGMADEIDDGDAINYAAQFYAAVANGQSILSAHLSGRAALELAGLSGADLPMLESRDDLDPGATILVQPPARRWPGSC